MTNKNNDRQLIVLADYATQITVGRKIKEEPPKYRTEFQRDRDRIIHASSFRKLEYKTQVFINHEGDLFRTRLTHSLEVAQIGRSVATALQLNVDLVEAICLAHDLGHTPFGHVGQDELNKCLIERGDEGFEHNLQSLRIVDKLEQRYLKFDGLNLTFETRQGILKHCSHKNALILGDVGKRFLDKTSPSLEAQLANVVDELAYNYHDIDDGLRANLITLEQLQEVPIINSELANILKEYPDAKGRRLQKELLNRLIRLTIYDLIQNTEQNIVKSQIKTATDVFKQPILVEYSEQMKKLQIELKKFLHANLYKHYSVIELRFKASKIIRELFFAYIDDQLLLPHELRVKIPEEGLARVVTDYIAGMTDRYAFRQYNKLFTVEDI